MIKISEKVVHNVSMTPCHTEEKAILEHTIRLHTRKTIHLNLSLSY